MNGADWSMSTESNTETQTVLNDLKPSLDAVELVPKNIAFAARLVPLRVEGRKLVCAGVLPFEWSQLRLFESRVCREVEIVAASAEAVETGLRQVYGATQYGEADRLIEALVPKPKSVKPQAPLTHTKRMNSGPMKVIAVTSGKGGVGKSSTTANLAIALAKQSFKVGVIDCDFGLSNMHVMLGCKPEHSLSDVLAKKIPMAEAFELAPGGIYLLAGPTGAAEFADLNYSSLQSAGAGLSSLDSEFDYLFLDTSAGIHDGVMSLLMAADEVFIVLTPDPASIMDAYVTARALLEKRPTATIKCIVNQTANETEAKLIFAKFMTFISLNTAGKARYLGKVQSDKAVVQAARSKSPVILSAPRSSAARDFSVLASAVAGTPAGAKPESNVFGRFFSSLKAA